MARQATAELAVIKADKEQIVRQRMQNDLMQQTNALMEGFRINGRVSLKVTFHSSCHETGPDGRIR